MGLIADLFRRDPSLLNTQDSWVRRIFNRIMACGTGELGVSSFFCTNCSATENFGAGCGSRNCPSCGAAARRDWVEKANNRLFPTKHFHAVFTLPHQLNSLIAAHPKLLLDLLMKSVAVTLMKFSEQTLKGIPAFMMVLHTWTQTLEPHYHVHVLIAAGSYSNEKWKPKTGKFLFPIRALSKVFRGKFLENLLSLCSDPTSSLYKAVIPSLPSKWNVYCAAPYKSAETTIKYFGKYANRVGISDSRILEVTEEEVTLALKKDPNEKEPTPSGDNANCKENKRKITLSIAEFIARFIIHILPRGFIKIRYGGLYASKSKKRKEVKEKLEESRKTESTQGSSIATTLLRCSVCQKEAMIFVRRGFVPQRKPP